MQHLLKISEFAQLSGISRKALIYYDEIGLLSPERVLENGYRFYSHRQIETASVIGALQEIGMKLSEIKLHLDERTPQTFLELLAVQKITMEEKIRGLQRIQAMIDTRLELTRTALTIDPSTMELRKCPEELLFSGEEIHCNDTPGEIARALKAFYDLCEIEKITYGYPFGTMVAQRSLLEGRWHSPSWFFYKIPSQEGSRTPFTKPAGVYLTGFELASYEGPKRLYGRMFEYISEHKLTIIGNAYEEFLLDEIAVKSPEEYLVQVSIQVGEI